VLSKQTSNPQVPGQSVSFSRRAPAPASGGFLAGIDVGSTTVKTVVRSAETGETLLLDYCRHESLQAETVLRALQ
jgi:activator of 2-hydroxyglutaryl-CoA dehydratase